ncbi:helix-turn-helix transcriptional regulator [Cellulomonas endometrii]|uniref:helix-turn-helix transcriptional regulator n=1 Tax=Cellulomonas endometrii TaxID=3036301 RepID=UPI0024AD188A|nr:LuxR C-terminal-related transcriptional regulator [Cellulomonas endometrii]
METEGFGVTVAAVQRWLPLGRDVLVRGDRGSGKSTVLQALLADASRRGLNGVLVRAAGRGPLSALRDHASAPARVPDEQTLTDWLADELGGRRGVLLLDDVDRVDPRSLDVVRRALGRTASVLVASTTVDPLRAATDGMRDVLLDRPPAEVRVQPFGFRAVASLLTSVLGAPADAGLTSSVLAQTGGNPRAVVALVDAARAAGALKRVDGLWVEDGTLGEVPADPVVFLFLAGLPEALVEALEFLSTIGPVPADVGARLVDPVVLAELEDRGRVVSHDLAGSGEMLGVAPPVLARALRERVAPYRRRQLAERVGAEAGPAFTPVRVPHDDLTAVLLGDTAGEGDDYWRWTAELAGLVHERASVEEAARRAAWLTAPTLRTANAYLALLMRRPARDLLAAVFEGTHATERDGDAERLTFAYYRSRWAAWNGASPAEVDSGLAASGADLQPFTQLRDLKERLARELAEGRSADDVADEPPSDVPVRLFRGWPAVIRAAVLLEAGRPEQALRVCAANDVSGAEPEVRHYLAAVQGLSLLMAGRLPEAERWQRRMLDTAYDEVDALGIRVHACVLGEILYFSDQAGAAWRVISTALRIGAAGPIETTFYRRGLTLGAVLQAHTGHLTLAQVLTRELDKTPRTYRPLVRSLRVVARIAAASAAGDSTTSRNVAWQAGQRYAEEGLLQPALIAWIGGPASLTPVRAQLVRDVLSRVHLPLLEPYVRLLLAVAEEDVTTVAELLPAVRAGVTPGLVRAAEQLVGVTEQQADGSPATGGSQRVEPLSVREREVVALARDGLTNRQIADRLNLSVRTVENHMSRGLRKLGYGSRADLADWRGP